WWSPDVVFAAGRDIVADDDACRAVKPESRRIDVAVDGAIRKRIVVNLGVGRGVIETDASAACTDVGAWAAQRGDRRAINHVVVRFKSCRSVAREENAIERDVVNQVVMNTHVFDRRTGVAVNLNAAAAGLMMNVVIGDFDIVRTAVGGIATVEIKAVIKLAAAVVVYVIADNPVLFAAAVDGRRAAGVFVEVEYFVVHHAHADGARRSADADAPLPGVEVKVRYHKMTRGIPGMDTPVLRRADESNGFRGVPHDDHGRRCRSALIDHGEKGAVTGVFVAPVSAAHDNVVARAEIGAVEGVLDVAARARYVAGDASRVITRQ